MSEDLPDSSPPTEGNVDPAQPAAKSDTGSQEDQTCDSDSTLIGQGAAKRKPHQFDRVEVTPRTLPLDIGDYRLVRKIGEGGMGVVFEAEQKSLGNRKLAIKTIKYLGSFSSGALKRFQNEVQAVAQLEHDHIVPVYHVGEESGLHFYVMKLIDGEDLRQLVNTLKVAVSQTRRGGSTRKQSGSSKAAVDDSTHRSTWSNRDTLASKDVIEKVSEMGSIAHPDFVRQFVRMGIQVATALHHVHENGIVHRDVKPANLILDVNGDVWLTDFGLARIRDSPALTSPGDLVGTYQYMSPEQAMGSRRVIVDHRSDIYSLGVTLYELLTLRRAFPGRTREEILQAVQFEEPVSVRKISSRVPADLETIVMKAMAKNPNTRFQSASEMAAELQRFQDGKPLTIRPPSVLERFGYWARTHRQLVASLAATLLVTFGAAIAVAVVSIRAQAATQQALEVVSEKKDEVTRLLQQSEGGRLSANSLLQLDSDPTLALLLGVEAAKHHPGSDANDAILRALDVGHEIKVLKGHKTPVGHVSFSYDGSKIISSAFVAEAESKKDGESRASEPAIIWDTTTGELVAKLQSDTTITSAVFGPQGRWVLTASNPEGNFGKNEIDKSRLSSPPILWDAKNHSIVKTFDDAILSIAHPRVFNSTGDMIVLPAKQNANEAVIYGVGNDGKGIVVPLTGHDGPIELAAFSSDGKQVVTSSSDNTVRVWDATNGMQTHQLDVSSDVTWVEFSPDGRGLGTGSATGGIKIWDLGIAGGSAVNVERVPAKLGMFLGARNLLATYQGEGVQALRNIAIRSSRDASWILDIPINNWLLKVVSSPGGKFAGVLHAGSTSRFQVWDLDRREMLASLGGGRKAIHDIAFSPESKLIATASADMNVRLWYVANGRDRATYPSTSLANHPIAVASPDGKILSVATNDVEQVGSQCDFSRSRRTGELKGRIVMPSSGGDRFLVSGNGRLAIHATNDGRFLGQETFFPVELVMAAINRDGDRVAAAAEGSEVMLWIPDENRRILLPVGNSRVSLLGFNPSGEQLFALSHDGKIRIWNAKDGSSIQVLDNGGRLTDLRFSRNAKMFAVAGLNNVATLYDAVDRRVIRRFSHPDASFINVQFSFDDKRLITFKETVSKSVSLWDIESGMLVNQLPKVGTIDVVVSPTRPEMLVCSRNEGAEIWRYEEDEPLPVSDLATSHGAYSVDGESFFLSTTAPKVYEAHDMQEWPEEASVPTVAHWDRESMTQEASIDFDAEDVHRILVSDQGGVFVNGGSGRGRQIINYDIESHEPISTIRGHFGPVSQCLFTSDSKRLITTSWDACVSLWDVTNGNRLSNWNDHGTPILAAAISGDDRFLVTGGRDGSLRIWDLGRSTDEQPVSKSVPVADTAIWHVAFDRDANRVLAIATDGGVYLFDRESGAAIPLEFSAKSVEWAEFSADGNAILIIPRTDEGALSDEVIIVPFNGDPVKSLKYPGVVHTSHFDPVSKKIATSIVSRSMGPDGQERDLFEVWIQNARTGQRERKFVHEALGTPNAIFDPTGEYVSVRVFGAMTTWRVSDGRRWSTIEDFPSAPPWHHSQNPFTSGGKQRIITRLSTRLNRSSPLIPLEATENRLPRSLTEAESRRFIQHE